MTRLRELSYQEVVKRLRRLVFGSIGGAKVLTNCGCVMQMGGSFLCHIIRAKRYAVEEFMKI